MSTIAHILLSFSNVSFILFSFQVTRLAISSLTSVLMPCTFFCSFMRLNVSFLFFSISPQGKPIVVFFRKKRVKFYPTNWLYSAITFPQDHAVSLRSRYLTTLQKMLDSSTSLIDVSSPNPLKSSTNRLSLTVVALNPSLHIIVPSCVFSSSISPRRPA